MAFASETNKRIKYDDNWEYEIFDNGYDLYRNDGCHITQRDQYSKIYKPDGTYEENALLQLESLTAVPEEPEEVVDEPVEEPVEG